MTAFILNITFECRDPVRLAEFWADATGYRQDPVTEPDRVRLTHPDPRGVRHLLFLRVDEPRAETRIHLDLASRRPGEEIDRLLARGASLVDDLDEKGRPRWRGDGAKRWVVLRDPEGNEFCVG